MWIFAGLCVIAVVVHYGLRGLGVYLGGIAIILQKSVDRAGAARGEPPILTKADLDSLT